MTAKLTDLGFSKGIIVEAIISTYSKEGKPNAAPMGITMIEDEHLAIDFFNTSKTFANIKAHRGATVNLTRDIELFYKTAIKEANPDGVLSQEWFEKATLVNAPKLRSADATIEISIYHLEAIGEEKVRAFFKVRSFEAQEKYPQVYCRAFLATLEAIINATRIQAFINDDGEQKQVAKLLELINNSNHIVNRVAPNSVYSLVIADLLKRIESWRSKTEK